VRPRRGFSRLGGPEGADAEARMRHRFRPEFSCMARRTTRRVADAARVPVSHQSSGRWAAFGLDQKCVGGSPAGGRRVRLRIKALAMTARTLLGCSAIRRWPTHNRARR